MSRLQKLKIENIKKANELLENGHNKQYPPQVVILKPSENVTNSSNSFVNKMSNLKEQWEQIDLNEEPEKDTYWMITKANRENLIKMGGTAEEIGKSATNNFQKYCK
jgi:hypothetical protein|tara:strand:+ start:606 stop:926 length:321 start_codon:yes stop_codon:yes gene_type:complete